MKLDKVDGEPVIWTRTAWEYYNRPKGFLGKTGQAIATYALTANRAFVLDPKNNGVIQQCNLANTTATVLNRRQQGQQHVARMGAQSSIVNSEELGDVMFIENGQVKLKFDGVPSPDSVVQVLQALARQKISAQPAAAQVATLQAQASVPTAHVEEQQVWSQGPMVAPMQFGEAGGWRSSFQNRSVKVRYIVTNKRAFIIGEGGEGNVKKFGIGDFYKTAYNVSHPVLLTKKLHVAKEWNGGLIAQCNLSDVEPAIVNRRETGRVGTRTQNLLGDIQFLQGGQVALTFERVEDPDGVISLMRQAQAVAQTSTV